MNIGRHNYTQQNKGKNVNANEFSVTESEDNITIYHYL